VQREDVVFAQAFDVTDLEPAALSSLKEFVDARQRRVRKDIAISKERPAPRRKSGAG
jgi:hypothetical protein